MIQYRDLPCQYCISGTIYLQGLSSTARSANKGSFIQGSGSYAYPRDNVVSTDFVDAASGSAATNIVLFGYDA